jgi:putative transposase
MPEHLMAVSVRFAPGKAIRWRKRRFVVVDYAALDTIIAREVGKRGLERIPINEVLPDHSIQNQRTTSNTNSASVRDQEWQTVVKQFTILKPLFEMDASERTRADVEKVARVLRKHPATIYRWIDSYNSCKRLSVFLRKGRSDRGKSRLSNQVNAIIETAIEKIYLTAEQPHMSAVIEEVELQCFKARLKKPDASTVRRRIAMVSDRLKLEKRKSKKAAAHRPASSRK